MTSLIFVFVVFQVFFLIPSYFLYKKYWIKKTRSKYIKTYSILATLGMPFVYTIIMIIVCYGIINPILRSKKFNSKDWIVHTNSRYRMVNDLEKNKSLEGKTKAAVIQLLGTEYSNDCWTKNTMCYVTPDPDNYALLDRYEFVIFFDDKNKVKSVQYINI